MRFGSVCSGIEAASVAWHPLGWRASFLSEIEAAPRAILSRHYPGVPLHGDFTTIRSDEYDGIDLLVGGTPCQDFSVAGARAGLDGERGNLTLEFARLARRLRSRWMVWENVPGVFSSNEGRDFGAVLACFAGYPDGHIFEPPLSGWRTAGVVEPADGESYGLAWRVLDAQFVRVDGFGRAVPQRRRRVFVVGYLGDWRRAAAVLFERASMSGHPAPRREAGTGAACGTLGGTSPGGGWRLGGDEAAAGQLIAFSSKDSTCNPNESGVAPTLQTGCDRGFGAGLSIAFGGNDTRGPISVATAVSAHGGPCGRQDFESETFVACETSNTLTVGADQTYGFAGDIVAQTLRARDHAKGVDSDATDTLVVAPSSRDDGYVANVAPTLTGQYAESAGNDLGRDGALIAFDTTQITSATNRCRPEPGDPCHPLAAGAHPPAVAFHARQDSFDEDTASPPLDTDAFTVGVRQGWAVRRLTPTECERLQGFPDGYTLVPDHRGRLLADGPRYKALGNSMASNVMRWIGQRIEMVEALRLDSTAEAA